MNNQKIGQLLKRVGGFVWRLAVPFLWLALWLYIGYSVKFYLPESAKSAESGKFIFQVLSLLSVLADRLMFLFTLTCLGAVVGILLLANAVRSVITDKQSFYSRFWLVLVGIPLTVLTQVWAGIWSVWPSTAIFLEIGVAVALLLPGIVEWALAQYTAVKE